MNMHRPIDPARAYGQAVPELVERFLPMVRKLAWHLHGSNAPGIEPEDLMQTGLVALTECAQRHQGPTVDGFAAYAKIRVKGAMIDQLRRAAPLSRRAIRRRREMADAEQSLRAQLGREPEGAEIAEAMGLDPAEYESMRAASEPLNFEPIDEAYSDSDMAFRDKADDPFAILASNENRDALVAAISALPERLQLVIQLYFVEELNLSEISQVLGVTVPRVHQLKDQALGKIRTQMMEDAVMI